MTLREALGGDVRHVYERVEALLDSEDAVLVLFDGGRMVTYAEGFGVSASQLELLAVELERALHNVVGRRSAGAKKRRSHEGDQRIQHAGSVNGDSRSSHGRVLRLASKIA